MDPKTKAQEVLFAALFEDADKSYARLSEINDKLTASIGAMAVAIDEMNASADRLVETKLIDLNNSVNNLVGVTIKNVIEQSLNAAVAKEIQAIRKEVGVIRGSLEEMHERSGRSQIGAAVGASLLTTVLALGATWYAISSGMIHLRDASTPVAQQAAVKQVPKAR